MYLFLSIHTHIYLRDYTPEYWVCDSKNHLRDFQIPPLLVDATTNIAFIFPSSAWKCSILGIANLSGVTYKAIDAIFSRLL